MEIFGLFLYWSGIALCFPCAFLLIEVAAGILSLGKSSRQPLLEGCPEALLLIPAHNEQALLGEMLDRLAAAAQGQEVHTIVIADNCTDDTAAIAHAAGVEVWERSDNTLRGKPYALAWALDRLHTNPPQVVVFLDADSWFEKGHPALLASFAVASQRPVQGIYRMADSGLRGFAFRFRNEARLRGLNALGAPVQLTGSGFAVPWDLLRAHPVPVGELVEDAFWGWTFTKNGVGPLLATEVEVLSHLPESKEGVQTQLRRWEHGILSATLRSLPGLLRSAWWPPRPHRIFHFMDVMVPPLALLGLSILLCLLLSIIAGGGAVALPCAVALSLLAMAVFLGWWAYGRAELPFLRLLAAPFYALGKVGNYLFFLFRRQKGWDRTERDGDE